MSISQVVLHLPVTERPFVATAVRNRTAHQLHTASTPASRGLWVYTARWTTDCLDTHDGKHFSTVIWVTRRFFSEKSPTGDVSQSLLPRSLSFLMGWVKENLSTPTMFPPPMTDKSPPMSRFAPTVLDDLAPLCDPIRPLKEVPLDAEKPDDMSDMVLDPYDR